MVRPDFVGFRNPNHRHGMSHEGKKHPLYTMFYNMHSRCYNPNNSKFHRYGGRGISVCPKWHDKIEFFTWAFMNGWQIGLSIDRKDNDGDYNPDNCQFIGVGPNSQKKSTTKLSFSDAENIRKMIENGVNEYDIATVYGVTHGTIWFIKNYVTHNY